MPPADIGGHLRRTTSGSDPGAEGGSASRDPEFSLNAIHEQCLPFYLARSCDEALGIDTPRIWTAERDREMWERLQG